MVSEPEPESESEPESECTEIPIDNDHPYLHYQEEGEEEKEKHKPKVDLLSRNLASPQYSDNSHEYDDDHNDDDDEDDDEEEAVTNKQNHFNAETLIHPHSLLPSPAPPHTLTSTSPPRNDDASSGIGTFIRQRSSGLSDAILKRISTFRQNDDVSDKKKVEIMEFNLSGVKVVVEQKQEEVNQLKGRITFFSRSNCRDCTAVRKFFREKGLPYVEINIDVFREREKELMERTGVSAVPQIFFNEKMFGGLVALNSLRRSGDFDRRVAEMLAEKCPDEAPAPPVYGVDPINHDRKDELYDQIRFVRKKIVISDRWRRMKIVRDCFVGEELVDALVEYLGCARSEAVVLGKQLARKHFIHHVFGEHDFEEGNHVYRFLEHEPFIESCYNFRDATNYNEPKSAAVVADRLTKIMYAILESYASDDRQYIDYDAVRQSEEFRRYVNMTEDLHRVNLLELSENEKLAFFLNLYNAMVIHAIVRIGYPEGVMERMSFNTTFQYLIGGSPFSISDIKNGVLRCNQRSAYSLGKPFGTGDKRLEVVLVKFNPLIHFGLCMGSKFSPKIRFFSAQRVEDELRGATRDFFENNNGIEVDLEKRTVHLTPLLKWFGGDFGTEKDILNWVLNYLSPSKSGLLSHLLCDAGPVTVSYKNFDWSMKT
ncbi:hypothetical protein S245_041291 [Arachis hypogaea]